MLNQDEQIALFVEAINKNAQKLCKKIDKEGRRLYSTEIEKIQREAQREMARKTEISRNEIETDYNKSLAASKAEMRRNLCARRREITDEVIGCAKERIKAFTLTREYEDFLGRSLEVISGYIKGDMALLVKEEDVEKVTAIAKKAGIDCTVKGDKGILLGGIKARSDKMGKIIDDTLDERLNEQREVFLSESGLTINI